MKRDEETTTRELHDMASEERAQRRRAFLPVGAEECFFVSCHAFLRVQVLLNRDRDYMVVVCRPRATEIYPPVLIKEEELRRAAAKHEGGPQKRVRSAGPPSDEMDDAPEMPAWASKFLFKCGRLTLASNSSSPRESVEVQGADGFSLRNARNLGRYPDAAVYGDYQAIALAGWRPAGADGGKTATAFAGALSEARANICENREGSEKIARHRSDLRKGIKHLNEMHARDDPMLENLKDGYAPGQVRPRPRPARPSGVAKARARKSPRLQSAQPTPSPRGFGTSSPRAAGRPRSAPGDSPVKKPSRPAPVLAA